MRITLCVILAAVHAARIRPISPNHVRASEAEEVTLNAAVTLPQVAGNSSTSLLQVNPPDAQTKAYAAMMGLDRAALAAAAAFPDKAAVAAAAAFYSHQGNALDVQAKAALATAITDRALNRMTTDRAAFADAIRNAPDAQAKAALATAITERALNRMRLAAETEFMTVLHTALMGIFVEVKAAAKADHDQVFHHGYYRAVKAEKAAKAAAVAAKDLTVIASHKAKSSSSHVVFKKLLEQAQLGPGASMKQFVEHIEKQVKQYVKLIEDRCLKFPEFVGLPSFLEEIRMLLTEVQARKGQPFDSEAMTKVMLGLFKVSVKSLRFENKVKHEGESIQRVSMRVKPRTLQQALQQDSPQEMSDKMKSELGLDAFLKAVAEMEGLLNVLTDQSQEENEAKAGVRF